MRLTTNGKVGPDIKEANVKDQAKGKSYGEVQSAIESIEALKMSMLNSRHSGLNLFQKISIR